jgi:hypothetical protein
MRKIFFWFGLLIPCFFIVAGVIRYTQSSRSTLASVPVADLNKNSASAPRTFERLRAAHYFADTYPKQFWNSFEPSDVPRDFAQIKSDGFNAIVLILPWSEFQTSPIDNVHDERMFERLKFLMDEANNAGLGVVLRLSFFWTYRPDVENDIFKRMHALFHDDELRDAWLAHITEMYKRAGKHPAFRLAFLSWEDLTPMALTSATPDLSDQSILRMYQQYLARASSLGEISDFYGARFSSFGQVPFPARKSPAYAKFFDYWDDALINRFFTPANRQFPNLSFEVRNDWDPVWDVDGKITWKNHASTYALAGTNTVTTYYATSWGMKNEGDFATAVDTLKGFDRFFEHLGISKLRQHLFIDQFLFYYELEEFKNNTQIKPEERDQFLREIAQRFRDRDISYALWYYRDYVDNAVYNAHFSLGLDGWSASPDVQIVSLSNGHAAVALMKGDQIKQRVPVQQRGAWKGGNKPIDICIAREANTASSVEVLAGAQRVLMKWGKGERLSCSKIPRAGEFELTIRAVDQPVRIDLVEVFTVLEPSAVYDRKRNPGPQLSAIRQLNRMVAGEGGVVSNASIVR